MSLVLSLPYCSVIQFQPNLAPVPAGFEFLNLARFEKVKSGATLGDRQTDRHTHTHTHTWSIHYMMIVNKNSKSSYEMYHAKFSVKLVHVKQIFSSLEQHNKQIYSNNCKLPPLLTHWLMLLLSICTISTSNTRTTIMNVDVHWNICS